MIKRFVCILVCVFLVGGITIGCSNKNTTEPTDISTQTVQQDAETKAADTKVENVSIVFLSQSVELVDWFNEFINEFNSNHPNIVVEQEFSKEANNLLKMKFASGDVPDITNVYSQDYVDQNKYVDLSDETRWWSRINPELAKQCIDIKSGKKYVVVTNGVVVGLFYNKDIFTKLGLEEATTWSEFVNNLTTIRQKMPEVDPLYVGGKDSWMLGHMTQFMAEGAIKQKYGSVEAKKLFVYNDTEKLAFDEPGGIIDTWGKRILELKDKKLLNQNFLSATYDNQLEAFALGKAAVISQGLWATGAILEKDPNIKDKIGYSPFPAIMEGMKPTILNAYDNTFCITSESKHIEEAKIFFDELFQVNAQKSLSELKGEPSAFIDVDSDWGVMKNDVMKALEKGVNITWTDSPSGFADSEKGRLIQDLYVGTYSNTIDFAKAFKTQWDEAWEAANK